MPNEPQFKSVFQRDWNKLPPVFLKRYANRPYSHDAATLDGKLDISYGKFMSFMMPVFRMMKILAPFQGKDIAVKVDLLSSPDSDDTVLDRYFNYPGKPAYQYKSFVKTIKDSEVIEYMSFGLGWRMNYFFDGTKVVMAHKGYVLKVFGYNLPLPLEFMMGRGHAEETVIDDNSYRVTMTITHKLFGTLYSYAGNFTFTRVIT